VDLEPPASDLNDDVLAIGRIPAVPTILDVVCRTTGMGFAAVARVTEDRWVACGVEDNINFGLQPGGELELHTTICNEIRHTREAVVIDHVAESADFVGHHTPAMYGFQSYISVPIVLADGRFFGTLCAIDPRPAKLDNPEIRGMFKLFAELIAFHLDAHYQLASSRAVLLDVRRTSELREQFIAVLGHDLRNPIAAIEGGMRLLGKTPLSERAQEILGMMGASTKRMASLIDDVMDFARGRLGDGIAVTRRPTQLAPVLSHVVSELTTRYPGREVVADVAEAGDVDCDGVRMGQLLSNLLANALTHGAPQTPIQVSAAQADGVFELTVANAGDPIPPRALSRLFLPFARGDSERASAQGLGLGLYIASEIAKAHGGTLEARSTGAQTRFTFRMPVGG
jgi:signal transduction histidine kinase